MAALDDCWQRIEWANSDGQTTQNLIDGFIATHPYTIHLEPHEDRRKATFERTIDPSSEAEHLAAITKSLGSFLDNTTAALNYLTYQLALLSIREDPPLKGVLKPDAVEFPIFDSRKLYRKQGRIKNLPDKYRVPIEDIQPYNGGHKGLWMLFELARNWRHRLIHPIAAWAPDQFQGVNAQGVSEIEIVYRARPLKHGDVVLTFRADDSANVYPDVAIAIGIDHPLCRDRGCAGVLQTIMDEVGPILGSLEARFFP